MELVVIALQKMATATMHSDEEVNKMKKLFNDPKMELVLFGSDVLTTSGGGGDNTLTTHFDIPDSSVSDQTLDPW